MDKTIEQIYSRIVELGNLDLQRKSWLNKNNDTGTISSYDELMCSLFDDLGFDSFIDNEVADIGFSNSLIMHLKELRGLLNNYNQKESDEAIINDAEWGRIVEQANLVINEWDK